MDGGRECVEWSDIRSSVCASIGVGVGGGQWTWLENYAGGDGFDVFVSRICNGYAHPVLYSSHATMYRTTHRSTHYSHPTSHPRLPKTQWLGGNGLHRTVPSSSKSSGPSSTQPKYNMSKWHWQRILRVVVPGLSLLCASLAYSLSYIYVPTSTHTQPAPLGSNSGQRMRFVSIQFQPQLTYSAVVDRQEQLDGCLYIDAYRVQCTDICYTHKTKG